MVDFFHTLYLDMGINPYIEHVLTYGTIIAAILFLSVLSYYISKKIFLRILEKFIVRTRAEWDDVLWKEHVFTRLAHLAPAMVIFGFATVFTQYKGVIQRFSLVYMIIIIFFSIVALLNAFETIYGSFEIAKTRPIKGYLQVIKIFVFVICGVIVVATVINKSPWQILTGIGAMTAVILFVFKDPILGLVASIQFWSNDMVHIGDWIEVPRFGADGDVIDISLTTIKVQNWDKTITTIPTYSLISDSFRNFRGMKNAGGRRIKRAVYIDVNSVKFCDREQIERFSKIDMLKDYIKEKLEDIESYNREHNIDRTVPVNGRGVTNIGTFRAYLIEYLKRSDRIRQDLTLMVRQLSPGENGIPIEVYAFANDVQWANYEGIQADIFDHIFAVTKEFELKIFQAPSGRDLKEMGASCERADSAPLV